VISGGSGCARNQYNPVVILGIDHVQIAAPPGCEEKARWFFGEVLGMTELEKPPELAKRGGCWFQCGTQQLHIGVEQEFQPARKAHPAFTVRYIISLKARLSGSKIRFRDDDANPEVKRIFADDPWGNRLEFVQA
jgi:catechol 2,3-dioxygenase-like lactoylglutathione lyase family enzyme